MQRLTLQATYLEATAAELPRLCPREARSACRLRSIWESLVEVT